MSQESYDEGGVPYRYGDAGAYRLSERVRDLERACSTCSTVRASQEVRISALEASVKSHLDRASTDAERAAVSATQTLSEIGRLREDISVMKARHGTVPVETIQRIVAIISGGFVIVGMVVGGIIWIANAGAA